MTYIPKQQPRDLLEWAEDYVARAGYVVLSAEMGALFESIEARLSLGAFVPSHEFDAVLFAIYAGPYGDYHQPKVFA
jgi:hypothetical protein